jgi:hypothetical protein
MKKTTILWRLAPCSPLHSLLVGQIDKYILLEKASNQIVVYIGRIAKCKPIKYLMGRKNGFEGDLK